MVVNTIKKMKRVLMNKSSDFYFSSMLPFISIMCAVEATQDLGIASILHTLLRNGSFLT